MLSTVMEYDRMKKTWLNFHASGIVDDNLSEKIVDSWLKSREMGVDPIEVDLERNSYTDEQLEVFLNKNESIIKIAEPVLEELFCQFSNENLIVTLVDEKFCVLSVQQAKESSMETIFKDLIKPGICFGENIVGTTAFSLCKKTGQIEVVSGYEHYCKEYSNLICVAAPIYDEDKIIAYIGTVSVLKNTSENLKIVLSIMSKMISNSIKRLKVEGELVKKTYLHSLIVDATSEGMLTVDNNGIITFINPAGMRILNVDRSVIGKHITEGVDFEPTILHVLETQEGYTDREFRLESKSGIIHFVKTAIPMRDDKGEMIGVLDIFRSINEVKYMINKMTGAQAKYTIENIVGESSEIQEIKKMIKLAGMNESVVLLQGEIGTGKELIARAIHTYGLRSEGPFIDINCTALPRNSIEGELFGYEEGSFTGTSKGGYPGKFEMANGGTLLLDEITDMPLDIQSKLLRVLRRKSVVRIGGFKEIPIDVRTIVTTNKDLQQMIKEKNFIEDLYYQISVIDIKVPPLRERGYDIELIANHMLEQYNLVNGTQKIISEEVLKIFQTWDWQGNVRELESSIECAYYLCEGNIIEVEHLQNKFNKDVMDSMDCSMLTIRQAEINAVKRALDYANGNVSKAAKLLDIGRNTLYQKIRNYGLEYDGIYKNNKIC
ncbi:sigma-54 interaction domain-containing protein [Sedimentibacter acidaminivorans]|nr:sigma 54-interacting transcriptional regulator [Sedimentibacter acidaminivorans]